MSLSVDIDLHKLTGMNRRRTSRYNSALSTMTDAWEVRVLEQLTSQGRRLLRGLGLGRTPEGSTPRPAADGSAESAPGPADEFQRIQRGLRRLSLASDRSGEILETVSAQLGEVRQQLAEMGRAREPQVALDDPALLQVLDELDRAAGVLGVPGPARALIERARGLLLDGAGWQPIAPLGGPLDDVGIRVTESLGDSTGAVSGTARVHRVLEQGYRRADGTLLRPAVVIAAVGTQPTSAPCESPPLAS